MTTKVAFIIIVAFAAICMNYVYSEGVRHGGLSVRVGRIGTRSTDVCTTINMAAQVGAAQTKEEEKMTDEVNHPNHYTAHPSGVECIQITEHMGFNLGNAIKYVWRADLKDNAAPLVALVEHG